MTGWHIRAGGGTFRLDDLTVMGAAQVCETAKCSLLTLDPIGQPAHLAALVAAFTATEQTYDEALLAVVQRNVAEVYAEHLAVDEEPPDEEE